MLTQCDARVRNHILLVHNYYQSHAPSGEDKVFEEDERLLRARGHDITLYTHHSDVIKRFSFLRKASLLWNIAWSRESYRTVEKLIQRKRPDIAHICNTFPLISPSVYFACHKYGIPVVQTVQNYRLFCASGVLFRNNSICEECLEHSRLRAVRYGCYRNSRLQTLPLACMLWIHEILGTWSKYVDIYVAATEFSRQKLIQAGLPEEVVTVKPNFFVSLPEPSYEHDNYVIFLGRLSVEKGVRTLLTAWRKLHDIPLKILGDGALRKEVEVAANNGNSAIEFLGQCPHEECLSMIKRARFLVMPSEWYEGFPMTIREAFSYGKPVVASRLGAMADIIEDGRTGLLFEPGNPQDLAARVQWMFEHEDEARTMGRAARLECENKYNADANYEILMGIYEKALEARERR